MAVTLTVNDLLDGHVGLDVECLDRLYFNGYVPKLQVGGQVVGFMTRHLGYPIPSPAIMEKIGTGFRRAVHDFAVTSQVPIITFGKARPQAGRDASLSAAAGGDGCAGCGRDRGGSGVPERVRRIPSAKTGLSGHQVWYSFRKADRRVTCFYFYLWDADFGPSFIKVCAYFPYPAKVWLNGHEWAKRQATMAGIGFTELSNGFASCTDPAGLQAICNRLGPEQIQAFFDRWMRHSSVATDVADRQDGYWWELSMRQIETSRTLVFDHPAELGRSSKPWWPTTSMSAAPITSRSSSPATPDGGDGHRKPSRPTRPGSTPEPRSE